MWKQLSGPTIVENVFLGGRAVRDAARGRLLSATVDQLNVTALVGRREQHLFCGDDDLFS
jgi:small ligand-binding sensory domain FIST